MMGARQVVSEMIIQRALAVCQEKNEEARDAPPLDFKMVVLGFLL